MQLPLSCFAVDWNIECPETQRLVSLLVYLIVASVKVMLGNPEEYPFMLLSLPRRTNISCILGYANACPECDFATSWRWMILRPQDRIQPVRE